MTERSGGGEWAVIARVLRPRGLRGELMVELFTDRPGRFNELRGVYLRAPGDSGPPVPAEVEHAWLHQGRQVLKLAGVDSIGQAEALRGQEVVIPLAERPPLPPGEHYLSDLVGCAVIERGAEEPLGTISGWYEVPGSVMLALGEGENEILIPLKNEICVEIDAAARRIVVALPEGLKELNRR